MAWDESLSVDRGVDRHMENSQCHVCIRGTRLGASLLVKRVLQTSVLLLIRGLGLAEEDR